MSRRNQVTVEFRVVGDGLAALERAHRSFRAFGGLGRDVGGLTNALARLNTSFGVMGRSAAGLRQQTSGVVSSLQRIGEITVGALGGNILAGIFTSAAAGAANLAKESVNAAISAEQALIVLRTQSKLTGTSFEQNLKLAKEVASEFRLSDTASLGLVGNASRVAAGVGKPEDTLKFLRAAADLSAASGRSLDGLNETLRQFASGGALAEAALDKIGGGENPGAIMDRYAKSVGVASDQLTELQRNTALWEFVLARSTKVQGVAQESLAGTAGRLASLSAVYENAQTRLGGLIVNSTLFQRGLEAIESVAARLGTPEALAWSDRMSTGFDSLIEKAGAAGGMFRTTFDIITRGAAVASAEFNLLADRVSIIWETATATLGNAFKQIALEIRQFTNDAMLALIAGVDSIPPPVKAFLGLGNVDTSSALNAFLADRAQTDTALKAIAGQNLTFAASAGARLSDADKRFAAAIANLPGIRTGPLDLSIGASSRVERNLGGAAGDFAGQFKLVPVAVEGPDGLTSGFAFQRVEASNDKLAQNVVGLTNVMEEVLANPVLARVDVVAGKDTTIEAVVPTGGANQP